MNHCVVYLKLTWYYESAVVELKKQNKTKQNKTKPGDLTGGPVVNNLPANTGTYIWPLVREDPQNHSYKPTHLEPVLRPPREATVGRSWSVGM